MERWTMLQRIFEEAVALEGAAREQYLDTACGSDPALRAEVASLLAASSSRWRSR